MNIAAISGFLTRDPELRRLDNGKAVTSFCVAVKRPYSKDKTDFHDCVAWGSIAEFIDTHFAKGSGIEVDGYFTTRNYEDKNGNKRKAVELVVSSVGFKGKSDSGGSNNVSCNNEQNTAAANASDYAMLEDDDEQLPF